MKFKLSILVIMIVAFVNAQSNQITTKKTQEVNLEQLTFEVEINSVEDLDEINLEEIKSLFEQSNSKTEIELIVHCNKEKTTENGIITESTITLKSTSDKMEDFLKRTQKLKKAITTIYN